VTQTKEPAITVTITTPSDREVLVTRQFNATRALVFEAVTKADLIKRWYGPGGAAVESCESDARPGGSFRFVTNAGGRRMVMFGVYKEMDAPRRFVRSQRWEGWDDRETLMTVELEEHGGRTTMTQRFVFPSQDMRDQVMKAGMTPQGMSAFYERLDVLLADLRGDR
jgi:uncharacterized protein YndB with AHSA1/START domain